MTGGSEMRQGPARRSSGWQRPGECRSLFLVLPAGAPAAQPRGAARWRAHGGAAQGWAMFAT
jgi:hypothetical protein